MSAPVHGDAVAARGPGSGVAAGDVGTAVLLAERGALTCARVMARDGSRLALESLDAKRFAVAGARLFWAGRVEVASAEALAAYWDEARRLAALVDLAGAWRTLEARKAEADPELVAALALAPERVDHVDPTLAADAVAVAIFSDPTHFKIRDRALTRESAAAVAETLARRAEKEAAERRLRLAVAAVSARLGRPGRTDEPLEGTPSECELAWASYRDALIDVAASGRLSSHWAEVEPLCQRLDTSAERAFELLVRLGELGPHENLAPHRAKIPLTFSADVLVEAERLAAHQPPAGVDLGALEAIAIDDADTTDVDDAMALTGSRVHVLISDAAAWIQPGSLLDRVAAERTSTVYLPEGKLPMLPPRLSDGPLSLDCDGTRQVLDFSFELAADGSLSGFEIKRGRARITRRLSYEEGDPILRDPTRDPAGPLLARLQALMDRHRAWRHARGAVTFQRPEVYYDAPRDGDGRIRLKIGDPLAPARQLVQELMVATCTGAALFCADNQIPCIYRAQAPPDGAPVVADPRTGRVDDAAQQYELLRRLKPSVLQLDAAPHWSLGVPAYTQVTSPIRRYADLLMHQQLAHFLKTGRPLFPPPKLQAHLFELGRRSAQVRKVEQESRRFYALRYLEQNPGTTLTATVLRELGKKTLCELQPIAIQELLQLKRRRPPGTVLRFEVIAADARKDHVQLKEIA